MKKATRKTMITILTTALILIFTSASAFASQPLADGQYTINVQALHATTGEVSMADNSIVKPAGLHVQNSIIHVILEMSDSMYDLAVANSSGGFDLAEEIAENSDAKTITYRFTITSIDEPVLMETVVAAMGRKVNFKLAFDRAALINTSTNTEDTRVENPNTGDAVIQRLGNIGLTAAILLIVGSVLKRRKITAVN